ncbi:hypothetical protein E2C01_047865 [Portunus trituberculatus]|uniref:Uncharacterized protein n=1 Tax=Portunus trituberculatus TaxID=210409 RepID=A0A5B7G1P2_PORTR|nr:hypothetical protein [Portunus trituberculatus]
MSCYCGPLQTSSLLHGGPQGFTVLLLSIISLLYSDGKHLSLLPPSLLPFLPLLSRHTPPLYIVKTFLLLCTRLFVP